MARKLKFLGAGKYAGNFIPGVPAQDHTCEDDRRAAELVKSGLYEYVGAKVEPNKQDEGGDK